MPVKHINPDTWEEVKKETMKAIFELKKPIKETEMLKWLISKGLEEITEDDYRKYDKK